MSRSPRCGGGPSKRRLDVFDPGPQKAGGGCTTQTTLGAFSTKKSPAPSGASSSTHGCPHPINDQISTDKSSSSGSPIHHQAQVQSSSSKTSAAASTTTAKVLRPFWNAYTKELSRRLWLPTQTDLRDSAWSSWNGYAKSMAQKSWFSTTVKTPSRTNMSWKTTYSLSQLSSWQETTDEGQRRTRGDARKSSKRVKTGKEPPNSARKIRLDPTSDQQLLLKKWMGTNRWTYNQAVASKMQSEQELRSSLVNNENYKSDTSKQWVLETPYEVRDCAIRDLVKSIKSTKQLVKNERIKSFKMSFRSKKDKNQSFEIRNRDYQYDNVNIGFTCFRGYFKKAGVDPVIRARELLPDDISYDARLLRTRLNHWYLCIPLQADMPFALGDENQVPSNRVCSLDPGVRTFQTVFDSDGAVIEVGAKDYGRLTRLCHEADNIQSTRDRAHGRLYRHRLRQAFWRILGRIRNLVDEVHKKLACFLVMNYNVVLLPAFETSQMTSKAKRKIRSKTVRSMLTWSHYRFKQRLLNKAYTTTHCQVVICGEEFTSQTCTACGHRHTKLGGNKIFKCPQCGLRIDRDYNGARNILLKNASHFHFGVSGVETTLLGGPLDTSCKRQEGHLDSSCFTTVDSDSMDTFVPI